MAPDREAWEKTHGFKPILLEGIPDAMLAEAHGYYEADASTLSFEECIAAQEDMLHLEERIAIKYLPFKYDPEHPEQEEPQVSYDPIERRFYHYPFKQSYEQ